MQLRDWVAAGSLQADMPVCHAEQPSAAAASQLTIRRVMDIDAAWRAERSARASRHIERIGKRFEVP